MGLMGHVLIVIRIGTAGYPEGSKGPVDAVRRIAGNGLNAMEVQFVRNVAIDREKAIRAGELARENDIALSAHAPYYVNLDSTSQETQRKSVDWIVKAIEAAQLFHAKVVVVHAATYSDKGKEATSKAVANGLMEVCGRIDLGSTKIGLETMGRGTAWGTLEEIGAVMEIVEGVIPVIDFAHIQARSGGALRTEEDVRNVLAKVNGGSYGLHCHLSGIEFTEAGERRHLRLGQGLDHEIVLSVLKRSTMPITVICESTAPLEDALAMRKFLDQ